MNVLDWLVGTGGLFELADFCETFCLLCVLHLGGSIEILRDDIVVAILGELGD